MSDSDHLSEAMDLKNDLVRLVQEFVAAHDLSGQEIHAALLEATDELRDYFDFDQDRV